MASFVNPSFETGDLTGWTGGGGSWSAPGYLEENEKIPIWIAYTGDNSVDPPIPAGPLPTAPEYLGGTPNNTVLAVTAGNDPFTGLPVVRNGNYSVRLNDATNDFSVSTLKQSVTNCTDMDIYFAWNAVLEYSHNLLDSDYFALTLHDDTTNTNVVSRSYSSAGSVGDGTSEVEWTNYNGWYSSGWVTEHIDLDALGIVGHDLTLTVLASDCPYGGHSGYVYLDDFTPTDPEPAEGPGVYRAWFGYTDEGTTMTNGTKITLTEESRKEDMGEPLKFKIGGEVEVRAKRTGNYDIWAYVSFDEGAYEFIGKVNLKHDTVTFPVTFPVNFGRDDDVSERFHLDGYGKWRSARIKLVQDSTNGQNDITVFETNIVSFLEEYATED